METHSEARVGDRRSELAGGLAFLEGVRTKRFGADTLAHWVDEHLVSPGYMLSPPVLKERGAGWIPLRARRPDAADVERVTAAAGASVIGALRGLVTSPQDDRFLAAAVFANRVRRTSMVRESRWIARPRFGDDLSAIVLSLFAVDVLHHRESYDAALSVCDQCDSVRFDAAPWRRRCCRVHSEAAPASGARRRTLAWDHAALQGDVRRAG